MSTKAESSAELPNRDAEFERWSRVRAILMDLLSQAAGRPQGYESHSIMAEAATNEVLAHLDALATEQPKDAPSLYVQFGSGLVDEHGDSVDFLVSTRPFSGGVEYAPVRSAEQSKRDIHGEAIDEAYHRYYESENNPRESEQYAFRAGAEWERDRAKQALRPSHVPSLMHVVSMLDHGNTKVAREEAMRLLNEVRGRE